VSKIRQAVQYERQLADAQVHAHRELTDTQLAAQKELLQQAIAYERKYTDGQIGQLNIVAQEHRLFHEREHLLYEDAIEKASTTLNAQLATLQVEFDRLRDETRGLLTVDRFEREHKALTDKMDVSIGSLREKIGAEERVTVKQAAQEELLTKISTNNRWLIGILITVAIFGATTLLHVFNVI
jgi:hypothetical protein